MKTNKKYTIELEETLVKNAIHSTGKSFTETVRQGLRILAATKAYRELSNMKGSVDLELDVSTMRGETLITVDTNIFIEYFRGRNHPAISLLENLLKDQQLIMNPFVLSELLSSPKLPAKMEKNLLSLPRIEMTDGFFERAGLLRRKIYVKGKGVPMADIFIAQISIDAGVSILTDDQDLYLISKHSNLNVVQL